MKMVHLNWPVVLLLIVVMYSDYTDKTSFLMSALSIPLVFWKTHRF